MEEPIQPYSDSSTYCGILKGFITYCIVFLQLKYQSSKNSMILLYFVQAVFVFVKVASKQEYYNSPSKCNV